VAGGLAGVGAGFVAAVGAPQAEISNISAKKRRGVLLGISFSIFAVVNNMLEK
jgi:hypothetical protein